MNHIVSPWRLVFTVAVLSVVMSQCSGGSSLNSSSGQSEGIAIDETIADAIESESSEDNSATETSNTSNTSSGTTVSETTAGNADTTQSGTEGQVNDNGEAPIDSINILPFVSKPVDVSSGLEHSCAIMDNGMVKCWGRGFYGQIGNGRNLDYSVPTQVAGITLENPVTQIAVGNNFTCALLQDHTVKCWGKNEHGQLGDGTQHNANLPVTVLGLNSDSVYAVQVTAGTAHSCALMNNGSIKCWGWNFSKQLGQDTGLERDILAPIDVNTMDGVANIATAVVAGGNSTCAIISPGKVKCWGSGVSGQAGANVTTDTATPELLDVFNGGTIVATELAGGASQFCALSSNKAAYCWGSNHLGSLGPTGAGSTSNVPLMIFGLDGHENAVEEISIGHVNTACALLSDGGVKCWGANLHGQAGDGNPVYQTVGMVDVVGIDTAVELSSGNGFSCVILEDGKSKCWGNNTAGQLGNGKASSNPSPALIPNLSAKYISAGDKHTCVITQDDKVKCWGSHGAGQLGEASSESYSKTPVTIQGLESGVGLLQVSSGIYHNCVLNQNSNVQCWGGGSDGQLGDNQTLVTPTPVTVIGLDANNPVVELKSALASNCVRLTDNKVKCWGENGFGQMANGGTNDVLAPIDFPLTATQSAVGLGLGNYHTCVALSSGKVICSGRNHSGQLGDGSKTHAYSPVETLNIGGSLSAATSLDGGYEHTCATLQTGESYCWGQNISNQLGFRWRGQYVEPVQTEGFGADLQATKVFTGKNHSCALTASDLYCWGHNYFGQRGLGVRSDFHHLPQPVPGIPGINQNTQVALGEDHTCLVLDTGAVYCWGSNSEGQIGESAIVNSESYLPELVSF